MLWCIVVGKPVMKNWKKTGGWSDTSGGPDLNNIGTFMIVQRGIDKYPNRREARLAAKKYAKENIWWNFHPKKLKE